MKNGDISGEILRKITANNDDDGNNNDDDGNNNDDDDYFKNYSCL